MPNKHTTSNDVSVVSEKLDLDLLAGMHLREGVLDAAQDALQRGDKHQLVEEEERLAGVVRDSLMNASPDQGVWLDHVVDEGARVAVVGELGVGRNELAREDDELAARDGQGAILVDAGPGPAAVDNAGGRTGGAAHLEDIGVAGRDIVVAEVAAAYEGQQGSGGCLLGRGHSMSVSVSSLQTLTEYLGVGEGQLGGNRL